MFHLFSVHLCMAFKDHKIEEKNADRIGDSRSDESTLSDQQQEEEQHTVVPIENVPHEEKQGYCY